MIISGPINTNAQHVISQADIIGEEWWDDWFAVPGVTCLAAYQAKGAPSYDDTKTNIADPDNYELIGGTDSPSPVDWDASTGWQFDGVLAKTLRTPLTADNVISMIYRFSGMSTTGATGAADGVPGFVVLHNNADHFVVYNHSTAQYSSGPETKIDTGIVAISDRNFYIGKTLAISDMVFAGFETLGLGIGCQVTGATANINRMIGDFAAIAFYDDAIDANTAEFEALVDRINAL